MKNAIKRIILLLFTLIYAFTTSSLPGYAPMESPLAQKESINESESYEDVPDNTSPSQDKFSEYEEIIDIPEYTPPTLEPKPDYSFPDDFTTQILPNDWFDECPNPGSIEIKEYPATDYLTGKEISKNMEVYLPYGYTPEIKYDVLILTHGAGDDEKYWFSEDHTYGGETVNAKKLVDTMIYRKVCRALIIASVTCTNNISCSGSAYDWNQLLVDGSQFSQELANDILPFIAENYSTYASDADKKALTEAREHFAYFGLSWSAMFGYLDILPENMDFFSWYSFIAPSNVNLSEKTSIISEKFNNYPIHGLYSSAGSSDQIRTESEHLFRTIITTTPLSDGENSFHVIIDQVNHHFESWCTGLYNSLLLFF